MTFLAILIAATHPHFFHIIGIGEKNQTKKNEAGPYPSHLLGIESLFLGLLNRFYRDPSLRLEKGTTTGGYQPRLTIPDG